MAKLKVVVIIGAVAVVTAVPLAVHYLRVDEPATSAPVGAGQTGDGAAAAAALKLEPGRVEDVSLRSAPPVVEQPRARAVVEKLAPVAEPDPVTALRERVLNPRNDPQDRLKALGQLRDRNARDAQVVAAMVVLARGATDPAIRADIFRQLHGTKDPALKLVLMEALQSDASAAVRGEAAESLDDYSSDPAVQALLSAVSRSDADPDTREAAVEARLKNASVETLRRVQEDPAATDLELYYSASGLRKRKGADAAQATVLVNVLKTTGNSDLRKEIVEDLGKHYANLPEIVEWMEHLATNEADPKVRKEAGKFFEEVSRGTR